MSRVIQPCPKVFEQDDLIFRKAARVAFDSLVERARLDDGNGRTARLVMNCMLSARELSRIMIPTVYREDYLLPLKALSHHREPQPIIAAMTRIQRWSAAFDYARPRSDVRERLSRCNAFQEDLRNYKLLFP